VKRAFAVGSTLCGTAAFAYALSVVGVANVEQAIARVGWGAAAILAISGVRELARAAAWAQTFTGTRRLSLGDAFRARMAGEALGAVVPMGFVVGEPAKARYVEHRMPFAPAFGGLMLEFAFYSASLAVFAVAALIIFVSNPVVVLAALAAIAIFALLHPVRRAVAPVRRFVIEQPRRAGAIGVLELVYHALGFAEAYVILRCLSPAAATWTAAVALETVSRGVTIAFKMVPMRVGIDEASAAFMATHLAIAPSTGVMLAVIRKLRVLFWTALGLLAIAVRAFRRCAPALTCQVAHIQKSA
jgi:Lysylphosphatidylglycerol synthase TM region